MTKNHQYQFWQKQMDKGSINEKWTKEKQMWVDLEMISPGAVVSTKLWIAPQWLVWVNYYITATTLGACSAPLASRSQRPKENRSILASLVVIAYCQNFGPLIPGWKLNSDFFLRNVLWASSSSLRSCWQDDSQFSLPFTRLGPVRIFHTICRL